MPSDTTYGQRESARKALSELSPFQLAYKSLPGYVALQHPSYRFAKHNLMIADALTKVENGTIDRLIINMPPRHGKTMLASEYFPAWYLGRNPSAQVIFAAYSYERAGDCGRKVRNQMVMPIHKQVFKACSVSKDAAGQNRMTTDQGGYYFALGVSGGVVGRGANLFIIDDPIRGREDADSEIQRRKLEDWYRGVAYTRLMPQNAIILIMTRWHFNDLAGMLVEEMKHEGWAVLTLPAIAEEDDDIIGRKIGEALWPSDFPVKRLDVIKETVGSREWNAQYQQTPIPSTGGMINIDDFKRYNYAEDWLPTLMALKAGATKIDPSSHPIKQIVMSWDTAFKEAQINDPSAGTIWGITKEHNLYLLETINQRLAYPKLKKLVVATWERYMKIGLGPIPVLIEDRASGQSLIQDLKRSTPIPIIAVKATSEKQVRMEAGTPLIEAGRVYLPNKPMSWVIDYETQLARFPLAKFDDLVDSTSQFLLWISKPRYRKTSGRKFWK